MTNQMLFLELMSQEIKWAIGATQALKFSLNTVQSDQVYEKIHLMREAGVTEFARSDFSEGELEILKKIILCWLEEIRLYTENGDFSIVSLGNTKEDLLELQKIISEK